jgi:acyl-CoA dehydrogenase
MSYRAPLGDIACTLRQVAGLDRLMADGLAPELDGDLSAAILAEAARFAGERLAPLNKHRRHGRRADRGWPCHPAARLGRGLSRLDGRRLERPDGGPAAGRPGAARADPGRLLGNLERRQSGLRAGPAAHRRRHRCARRPWRRAASARLSAQARLRRVDGHHEPDRAAGRLRSVRPAHAGRAAGDGSYRIFGQKIYITYGEHDLTANIMHLVLARLPDAPAGTRGISLFLVPKRLVDADGTLGARNDRALPQPRA